MRSLGLLVLITVAFTSAEEPPPPPPPRVMVIHVKDAANDSIACSRIDPIAGVTFDGFQMKVGLRYVNPYSTSTPPDTIRSIQYYCTGRIDSITFIPGVTAHASKTIAARRLSKTPYIVR